jgi:predicted transcriptional regulator of viral defense system
MKMNLLGHWVDSLQSSGRYTFLRKEAVESTGLSSEAARKGLQRLAKRKRIARVKDYFYVIVPTEYLGAGAPPASWFIHPLMEAMGLPYYVGLLTAAALHGASHQQPQEFQVITDRFVRPLRVGRQRIHFVSRRHLEEIWVTEVKTPTGPIRVSTPEATVVDLVRFNKSAGYLDNVATVIGELSSTLDAGALLKAIEAGNELPVIQRLGYVFDVVGARQLADTVAEWIERHHPRPTPLVPGRSISNSTRSTRWNIIENDRIEVEI